MSRPFHEDSILPCPIFSTWVPSSPVPSFPRGFHPPMSRPFHEDSILVSISSSLNQHVPYFIKRHKPVSLRFYRYAPINQMLCFSLFTKHLLCSLLHYRIREYALIRFHQQQTSSRTSIEIHPARFIVALMRIPCSRKTVIHQHN